MVPQKKKKLKIESPHDPAIPLLLIPAKSFQLCLSSCDPLDCSLPGSSVHGIFPGKNTEVGCHTLLQGIFPIPGIETPSSLTSPTLAGGFFTTSTTWEDHWIYT